MPTSISRKGRQLAAAAALALPLIAGAVVSAPTPAYAAGCDGFRMPEPLPPALFNQPYHASVVATGGTAPYQFAITHGALPLGLKMASDGAVTGSPLAVGNYQFDVTATDSDSPACSVTELFLLQVKSPVDAQVTEVEQLVESLGDPEAIYCLPNTIVSLVTGSVTYCRGT